jgi:hypothetical protein
MKTTLLVLGLLGTLILPAAANGDVVVNAVPTHLACGDAIRLGMRAQPGTTGNRAVADDGHRPSHRSCLVGQDRDG